MAVAIEYPGCEATLEEMADGPVGFVIVHRVALIDPLEDFRERRLPGLNQKVDVVAHEAVGPDIKRVFLTVFLLAIPDMKVIIICFKYQLPVITSLSDMVGVSFRYCSCYSGHGVTLHR